MRHGDGSGGEDKRIVFISAGGEAQCAELWRKVSLFSSSFMNLPRLGDRWATPRGGAMWWPIVAVAAPWR